MSLATTNERKNQTAVQRLEAGDHLDQPTFHERYLAMAPDFRAELIGGMVIVPSPTQPPHAEYHAAILGWLYAYHAETPGTRPRDNGTIILGPDSEPQPDAALVVEPECGGRSRVNDAGYAVGPPELIVEVASSSVAYDLYEKRTDYERAGVLEYAVVLIHEREVHWFALEDGGYAQIAAENAVYRSRIFPGLWLDVQALLDRNATALLEMLQEGLQTPEHAAFVQRLQDARS
jgi:Uma2 family endonuclease